MINCLEFLIPPPTTSPENGLHWDDATSSYRCPTCSQQPRALILDTTEAAVCNDCAAYWPIPPAA